VEYLLEALLSTFPGQELGLQDVMSTFSGLRPVINTGKSDPSRESREHAIWNEKGLLTISGGKLTTFRVMARQALQAAHREFGGYVHDPNRPVLRPFAAEAEHLMACSGLSSTRQLRLLARYGSRSAALFQAASSEDCEPIGSTLYTYAELRQAARSEAIVHLDDLLLRRVRLGLLSPQGGIPFMSPIRSIVQAELGWDDARWEAEAASYVDLWQRAYSLKI
jgi:glycerol-3-phosphate dehydrogenase